jgi:hypothetical protein
LVLFCNEGTQASWDWVDSNIMPKLYPVLALSPRCCRTQQGGPVYEEFDPVR